MRTTRARITSARNTAPTVELVLLRFTHIACLTTLLSMRTTTVAAFTSHSFSKCSGPYVAPYGIHSNANARSGSSAAH